MLLLSRSATLFRDAAFVSMRRLGAWLGLFILALDLLAGTALPVARAAAQTSPIPWTDLVVCTLDGRIVPHGDGDETPVPMASDSLFCAACLPLVHLLPSPETPRFSLRVDRDGVVFSLAALPWPTPVAGVGFSARAPPAFV